MNIHLFNAQKDFPINKRLMKRLVQSLFSFLKIECADVAFYFVNEKKIKRLHKEYFNDPTSTDCITFPLDDSYLGEVFICPKVALAYAEKRGLSPQEELILYMVHGILHLIGFDDLTKKEKEKMRKKEKSCMEYLRGYLQTDRPLKSCGL